MNSWVENAYEIMKKELQDMLPFCSTRLRFCNAYVLETKNFYVLRSYQTIVACIRKDCLQSYDFLRMVYGYTAISAQHISKFFHDYGDSRIVPYVYRDIKSL
ncbi:MAG: hypothetical protein J6S67_12955 [Methanobrevibacter sp.]|nr:hypothetical protein [Methanobrevibacter sp.]